MIERYDKLDCMLFAAASEFCKKDVETFDNLDVSDVPESKRYIKKRERMIAKHRHKPFFASCRRLTRAVAVVLAVIFSLGFITVMSVSAFRNAVIGVIVDWFEDYVQVEFEDNDASDENAGLVIEDLKKITALPEGMVEEISMEYGKVWMTTYLLNDERICSLRQEVYRKNMVYIDNNNTEMQEVYINDMKGYLFVAENNTRSLYWNDGEYTYVINCYNEEMDVVELAKSIQ